MLNGHNLASPEVWSSKGARMAQKLCFSSQRKRAGSLGRFSLKQSGRRETITRPLFQANAGGSAVKKGPVGQTDLHRCADIVSSFLIENKYDRPMSMKILYTPTGPNSSQFLSIFEFIFQFVDRKFKVTPQTVLEDVTVDVLKMLNYPFSLNKSQIKGIGTQHGWRPMLPALSWLCTYVTDFVLSDWPVNLVSGDFGEDYEKGQAVYDYHVKSFKSLFAGKEDHPELDRELEDLLQCEYDMDAVRRRTEEWEKMKTALQEQLNMKDEVQRAGDKMAQDVANMKEEMRQLESQNDHVQSHLCELDARKQRTDEELIRLKEEIEIERANVAAQMMSQKEAEDLKGDANKLANMIAAAKKLGEKEKECIWAKERELASWNTKVGEAVTQLQLSAKLNMEHRRCRTVLDFDKMIAQGISAKDEIVAKHREMLQDTMKNLNETNPQVSLQMLEMEKFLDKKEEVLDSNRKSMSILESEGERIDQELICMARTFDAEWKAEKMKLTEMMATWKNLQATMDKYDLEIEESNATIAKIRKDFSDDIYNKKRAEMEDWLRNQTKIFQDNTAKANETFEKFVVWHRLNCARKKAYIARIASTAEAKYACEEANFLMESYKSLQAELQDVDEETKKLINAMKK